MHNQYIIRPTTNHRIWCLVAQVHFHNKVSNFFVFVFILFFTFLVSIKEDAKDLLEKYSDQLLETLMKKMEAKNKKWNETKYRQKFKIV